MQIPPFTSQGILPPFVESPASRHGLSPYPTTLVEICHRFGSSPARTTLLRGLVAYRRSLRKLGFHHGFQWLDGSFVEEMDLWRSPQDIDVVTFFEPPRTSDGSLLDLREVFEQSPEIFHPGMSKKTFSCDGYFVDLSLPGDTLVERATYWYGLFSHQRLTGEWKGMLSLELGSDELDSHASSLLGR